jgi:hypothetical protein
VANLYANVFRVEHEEQPHSEVAWKFLGVDWLPE